MSTHLDQQSRTARASHVVHFYDKEATLHDCVAAFIGDGLLAAQPAVIIATLERRQAFQARLAPQVDIARAVESGALTLLDARETLESFMRGDSLDPTAFEQVAETVLTRAAPPGAPVRLFGEMVDVLCREGRGESALELEQLWSRLARKRRFTLFCGYGMDTFARGNERLFAGICAQHGQVIFPPSNRARAHARLKAVSEAERRLREAEGFQLLVESVKDYAIYMLDTHGVVTSWNAGAERIKGYSAREAVGTHFSHFYPESDVSIGKCELDLEVAALEGRFEDEGYRVRKDGTRFWANVVITPLRDKQGGLVGYAKVTRDLTERRKAEHERLMLAQAQESNRVKDDFLATISHELRTPLSAILGWAQLLAARVNEPYLAKGIETIRRNAQAQARIIEDVLDVARITSGKLGIETRPIDLVPIVRAGVEGMRITAESKGVGLGLGVRPSSVTLLGDPTRLQQILWNLLSNALKFTPQGGHIAVTLDTTATHAHLSVRDDGSGIEQAFLPHVFERFSQSDGSSARRAGGLGLGLAIVRHLVELHGGQVDVESDGKDRGATFSVVLPLAASDADVPREAATALESDAPESRAAALDGVRVLVVEDEPDARELVGELLEGHGARVALTASAAEAYASLDQHLPDVIVSDIGMPDEDGYQFARRLRAFPRERGGSTPMVALTAYASAQDRHRALEAGYNHHLAKPVDTQELVRVLGRLARQAKALAGS
jgi:PAS domain S-box-containing protein